LEPWRAIDFSIFARIARDPDVMRYITGGVPWTDDEIRGFIRRQMKYHARHGFCLWRIVRRQDGALLGFCGLQPLELDGRREVEIGWWLAKRHWKRGLATEAARRALGRTFAGEKLRKVVAIAMPENTASRRIMHKIGLRYHRQTRRRGFRVVCYSGAARFLG